MCFLPRAMVKGVSYLGLYDGCFPLTVMLVFPTYSYGDGCFLPLRAIVMSVSYLELC